MNKSCEQILFELTSMSDNIGIYPAAIIEKDKTTNRSEFQSGWNACVMNYGRKIDEIFNDDESWATSEKLFAASGGYFLYDDGWYVNLNDTWYYACADCEQINKNDYDIVADWFKKFGDAGVLYWVYTKRGNFPEIPKYKKLIELIKSYNENS